MKQQRTDELRVLRMKLLAASAALAFSSGIAIADKTDLADVPLANSTTLAVPPNLALVIDDSGSMDDENMPDGGDTNATKYCYRWYNYNTLAYNPTVTYKPPIKSDKTRFPDASFAAAPMDGYFAVDGSTKMYDRSTTNANVDLNYFVTQYSKITFPDFVSTAYRATSVLVTKPDNSTFQLLATSPAPAAGSTNEDTVGNGIANSINANTATTNCFATYDTANSGSVYGTLRITCPASLVKAGSSPTITMEKTNTGTNRSLTIGAFGNLNPTYYATHKTDTSSTNCAADTNYNIVTNKANIAAPGVANGSAAALTNFANWYSYYRKRAFMMKAGVGEAFSKLQDGKFRVGYFTIDSADSEVEIADGNPINRDLAIADFTGTTVASNRGRWYERVYGTRMAGYTPLRGALSRMGRIYSGKVAGWDPVQYSCQRNFTLLTTDGYWNTNAEDGDYGPFREDNSTSVGNQDGSTVATLPERDKLDRSDTLADVAYYYYHNDLRTSDKSNCTGAARADSSTGNVCENDVPGSETATTETDYAMHQHMTTYTLGLGVTGTLAFDASYKTQTAGDYYDIKNGTAGNICGPGNNIACQWPTPAANSATAIDDLWHAAVNGRGLYLSAKNPTDLATSLSSALNSMQAVVGSGAGAAASSLAPTTTTTAIYVAEYKTDDWIGDVAAYDFDISSGTVSGTATWKAGELLDARIGADGSTDTRTIYVSVAGVRKDFTWTNLSTQQKAYFDNTKLSQYAEWSAAQLTAGTGEAMVNYLRGRYINEDQVGVTTRLYRDRKNVLGDIIHAQPMYVKESYNNFVPDKTYGHRMGMLYVAANDGMLHAFCTESAGSCTPGKELWAYVVPPVMKNMWYLADKLHQGYHHYFVDGPLSITDVQIGGQWRTLLVGGLGKGGRGYYAMDITNPSDPSLLWTFTAEGKDDTVNTADDNPNVGYSYGLALATKVNNNWRVLVSSGYNNIPDDPNAGDHPTADGQGYVFLLDPATGDMVDYISTGSGSTSSPSGLAQIQTHVPNFTSGNAASKAYGGDLNGDMWRFDLVNQTATKVIATGSPITTGTAITTVSGHTALIFGTGAYLGQTDLSDTSQNYIVAVKANQSNLALNAASKMLDQTDQDKDMNWSLYNGWYRRLGNSERVHIDPAVYAGTLLMATVVPEGTECKPGGYSYLYSINIDDGIGDGTMFDDPLVGFTIIEPPVDPKEAKVITVDAKGKVAGYTPPPPPPPEEGTKGTRIMWRELID